MVRLMRFQPAFFFQYYTGVASGATSRLAAS
jgi:hypothetical protein